MRDMFLLLLDPVGEGAYLGKVLLAEDGGRGSDKTCCCWNVQAGGVAGAGGRSPGKRNCCVHGPFRVTVGKRS